MTLWFLLAIALLCLSGIISLVAWIVSVIEGFKVHVGWGLLNILGGLCLLFIPQIIFSLVKLEDRWPLLVLILGGIIPGVVGLCMLTIEGLLQLP